MPVAIYRFARDLRLADHAGLSSAAAHGDVLPVLIIDRDLERRLHSSPRRAAFYCAAVWALDVALRERSSALTVRHGEATDILPRLARELGAAAVV